MLKWHQCDYSCLHTSWQKWGVTLTANSYLVSYTSFFTQASKWRVVGMIYYFTGVKSSLHSGFQVFKQKVSSENSHSVKDYSHISSTNRVYFPMKIMTYSGWQKNSSSRIRTYITSICNGTPECGHRTFKTANTC